MIKKHLFVGVMLVILVPAAALADATSSATSAIITDTSTVVTAGTTVATSTVAATTTPVAPTSTPTVAQIEAQVKASFSDIPIMISIANCESGFREFNPDGTVFHGGTNNAMVGIFQIDPSIHTAKALSLGFDINTVAGNIGYARYLYNQQGTNPWISSFSCWDTPSSSGVASSSAIININMTLGLVDAQVFTLQELLNDAGFTLATSGPGSPGNETTKFGSLTLAAVEKFQCAENIVCSGDPYSTGYGFVNAVTTAKLLSLPSSVALAAQIAAGNAPDNPAQIAALQQQIAQLVAIVAQLEAQLALAKK